MFKFVLCALLAAAVAEPEPEPGAVIAPYVSPYGYSSPYLAPATTTITRTASSYISDPYFYPHFIKKRAAPIYLAPPYSAYSAPLVTHALSSPLLPSVPALSSPLVYSAPAHFIKKRSAPLISSAYIAPAAYSYAATAPLLPSAYPYAAAPIVGSAPIYSSPFGYSHFIKKRSAQLLPYSTGYIAPAVSAPLLTSPYGVAPIVSAPWATLIKK